MPHNRHAGKGHCFVFLPFVGYLMPVTMDYRGYKASGGGGSQEKYCPCCRSMQPCDAKESWHTVSFVGNPVYKEKDEHARSNMVPYNKCRTCQCVFPPRHPSNWQRLSSKGAMEYLMITAMAELRMRQQASKRSLYRWTEEEAQLVRKELCRQFAADESSTRVPVEHILEQGNYVERIALYREKSKSAYFPAVTSKLSKVQKEKVVRAMEGMALAGSSKNKKKPKGTERPQSTEETEALVVSDGDRESKPNMNVVKKRDQKLIDEVRLLMEETV